MKIVLPADVGLKRHAAVGKKHGPSRVTTPILPELFVHNMVCHSEVFGRPFGSGPLSHLERCDQRFILAPEALQVFILADEMEFQPSSRRSFNRPPIIGVVHINPLRKSPIDVIPSRVEMMMDALGAGIPQRRVGGLLPP